MATKLIVSELPGTADELQIRVLFEKYGPVSSVSYPPESTAPAKSRAFVEMFDADAAQKAITGLNNRPFLDTKIHVTQMLLGSRG